MVGQVPDGQRDHYVLLRCLLRQLHAAKLQLERREAVHQRLLREGGRQERLESCHRRCTDVIGSRHARDDGVTGAVHHHADDGQAALLLLADARRQVRR